MTECRSLVPRLSIHCTIGNPPVDACGYLAQDRPRGTLFGAAWLVLHHSATQPRVIRAALADAFLEKWSGPLLPVRRSAAGVKTSNHLSCSQSLRQPEIPSICAEELEPIITAPATSTSGLYRCPLMLKPPAACRLLRLKRYLARQVRGTAVYLARNSVIMTRESCKGSSTSLG